MDEARQILRRLEGESVSPEQVGRVSCSPPFRVYPALRRKDLLELFDTTPDLLGDDVDISPFIRDAHEADLFVYYRDFDPGVGPDASERAPRAEELVRVPVSRFRDFAKALVKKARGGAADQRLAYLPWVIDPAGERRRWVPIWQPDRLTPGRCVLLHVRSGGYNPELGWTGEKPGAGAVEPVLPSTGTPYAAIDEHLEADPRSAAGTWVALEDHLRDVVGELDGLLAALASIGLSGFETRALRQAAAWHDVGKAHPAFQAKLCFDLPAGVPEPPQRNAVWAKAPHRRTMLGRRQRQEATKTWGPSADRPFFRHELASALAWLDWAEQTHSMAKYVGDRGGPSFVDLVAYLIAAHHGKVRLSIRSVPGESEPPMLGSRAENLPASLCQELEPDLPVPFARGVWHGDELRLVRVPNVGQLPPTIRLDLRLVRLGEGSWAERMRRLLHDERLGPFRLGYLEALLRVSDWRASARYGSAPDIVLEVEENGIDPEADELEET